MRALVLRFVKDQSAATAIEYGLIAAGISIVIMAVVFGIGSSLNVTFSSVSTALPSPDTLPPRSDKPKLRQQLRNPERIDCLGFFFVARPGFIDGPALIAGDCGFLGCWPLFKSVAPFEFVSGPF